MGKNIHIVAALLIAIPTFLIGSSPQPPLENEIDPPRDEWSPFINADFRHGDSESTLEVVLFYSKEMKGMPVPIIILATPSKGKGEILFKDYAIIDIVRADPFNEDATAEYGISFEVNRDSFDRVFVGGVLRPNQQLRSLKEIKSKHTETKP